MKEKIADMTCLQDINDYDEEFFIDIGIQHRIHRKRIIKAIGLFVTNKNKFELWWNETIQFKKYLKLFQKNNIWDLEELLLQIRNNQDIMNKMGIVNENDVDMIMKHVDNLRHQHTLYSNIQATGSILTPNMMMPTVTAYNPNAMHSMQPTVPHAMPSIPMQQQYPNNNNNNSISSQPHNMNYSAPPMYPDIAPPNNDNNANANESNISIKSNESQQEGAVTQM